MVAADRLVSAFPGLSAVERDEAREWFERELAAAVGACPSVTCDACAFVDMLGERMGEAGEGAEWLRSLHLSDLFLAFACASGDRAGLALFEEQHLRRLDVTVRHVDLAEVKQALRVRLLVAEGGAPPRIAQYSGRGPLSAWVRMSATRVALDLARANHARAPRAADLSDPETLIDPELDYLKARYGAHFKQAIEQALTSLPPRETALLKLCYLQGASSAGVARMYGVSERTVQRWLEGARASILDGVRTALQDELALSRSELDGLLALVQSRLHVTLERVLGAESTRTP